MWDKLVSKYENIVLVLSGHDPCDNVIATQTAGVNGNVVTQMLIDPQGVDSSLGATGMVAMLYFSNDGRTLTVEQYSTVRDEYYMNTSQFALELPESFHVEAVPEDKPEDKTEEKPQDGQPTYNEPSDTAVKEDTSSADDQTESVIGGADTPTSITVSRSFDIVAFVIGIAVGAVLGVAAAILIKKKK